MSATQVQERQLAGDWDINIRKTADQDVTNNATVQNDTQLLFSVASGEVWYGQLLLIYSGNNATGDYKFDFGFPTVSGWLTYIVDNTTADVIQVNTGIRLAAATALAAQVSCGTDAAFGRRMAFIDFQFLAGASGTFQFKFGNAAASAGRTSRTHIGSRLRAKKLA